MAECRWNISWTKEVYNRDPKEVWDDGLQIHGHTYGIEPEAIECVSLESVDAMMYHQMIGSLMYLMNMRPDICFVVNTLSQLLTDSRHVHLIATKHILRYLLPPFHTPGSCGRNLQAARCVLGGKSGVKAVTLFLTPPFRLNS